MKRALRRHHYRRLKARCKHYWGGLYDKYGEIVAAPKPFSGCPCCMNPRKLGEVTRQEQLDDIKGQDGQE